MIWASHFTIIASSTVYIEPVFLESTPSNEWQLRPGATPMHLFLASCRFGFQAKLNEAKSRQREFGKRFKNFATTRIHNFPKLKVEDVIRSKF